MALIVEDGTGIAGAESYFAIASADSYWAARPQDPNAATWAGLTTGKKEGAAREASDYLDAIWGTSFPGARETTTQGRLWPRVNRTVLGLSACYPTLEALAAAQALTDAPLLSADGLVLPALPPQIVAAAIELAARAGVAPLAADKTDAGWVKRLKEKVGPLETETEFGGAGQTDGSYGFVDRLLGPLAGGVVSGDPTWLWA